MSITDELRRWAEDRAFVMGESGFARRIADFCDRIDAEHEAKVAYWQEASYKDGYDEGFASADDWLAQHEDAMAEHGWVKLPVDADGEYIHIGDVMTVSDGTDEVEGILRDRYLVLRDGDWMTIRACWAHHYKQPTVEDVLRDFAEQYAFFKEVGTSIHPDLKSHEEVLRQFAAKLRLAGDSDE